MKNLTREKQLETLLTICLGLAVLFFISQKNMFLVVLLGIGAIGLFSGKGLYWLSFSWLKLGELLGAVSSKIILSLIYFLVLVPVAFLAKLSRRNNSFSVKKEGKTTYFHTRNHLFTAKDLENTW